MPKPPMDASYFDKVNFVIDSWSRFCDAPWYIYVETLKPAALEAFITLATFGWDDVARGYFRPKNSGPMRRSRKKKGRKGRGLRGLPELGEETGKRLPGAEQMKGERWSTAGHALWRIDAIAQRALFWWLVADVTSDFAVNWTSALYETVFCQASTLGRFSYYSDHLQVIQGNGWWKLPFPIEDYEFGPPNWAFNFGQSGPSGAQVTAGIAFEKYSVFDPPGNVKVRIQERHSPVTFGEGSFDVTNSDGSIDVPFNGTVPPNKNFEVQIFHDAPFASVGSGVVVGIEAEDL